MPRGSWPSPSHPAPDFTWALERPAEHPGTCKLSKPEILASLNGKIEGFGLHQAGVGVHRFGAAHGGL